MGSDAGAQNRVYLFGKDAERALDSLTDRGSADFLTMGILAHNLSFSQKKAERTRLAQAYFERARIGGVLMDTLKVYESLLALLVMRDEGVVRKAGELVVGFLGITRSPYDAAQEVFDRLSKEIEKDPENVAFRFLRATAAIEVADHLPEVLPIAEDDLLQLGFLLGHGVDADSTTDFFFPFTCAKYHFRCAKGDEHGTWEARRHLMAAHEFMGKASKSARGKWQQGEIKLWDERIEELFAELCE